MKLRGKAFVFLLIVLLVGCGTNGNSTSTSSTTLKPTVLHVLRPILKDYGIPSLDRTVQNAVAVQRLYTAAYKLPAPPSGRINCPLDIGLVYQLDFLHDKTSLQKMTLQATGCQYLFLNTHDVRITDYAFQLLFLKTIDVPSLVPGQSHP